MVLIACEESQVVCNAFRARGHEAYSCDILPTRGGHPEWHIQDDALKHLNGGWDLIVSHPDCRCLTNAGVTWLYNKDGSLNEPRWADMKAAAKFFKMLLYAPIDHIVVENPILHKYAREEIGVSYGQLIHPWMFGHMEQKPTGLWLKNVPALKETDNVYEEMKKLPANKRQRIHYMSPSATRPRDRAVTYQGIANAMADQWGCLE